MKKVEKQTISREITKCFCDLCSSQVVGKYSCHICGRDICGKHVVTDPICFSDYPDTFCTTCWNNSLRYRMKIQEEEEKHDNRIESLEKQMFEYCRSQVKNS